jgi:N-acetylglutamate synthase-like GNAT family acetyltransferase
MFPGRDFPDMEKIQYTIAEIGNGSLEPSADIVRRAFGAVTGEFGITEENCPRFPAYTTAAKLEQMRNNGGEFFGAFIDGSQVGVIAVEKEEDGRCFAKRLAVLPQYWHRGLGEKLMDRAIEYMRGDGAGTAYIAIVNEHTVLKNWYIAMGFRELEVEKLDFLPFDVGFLKKDIA